MLNGVKLEHDSLEESLARVAFEKHAEIEFLKVMAICNAVMTGSQAIMSQIAGGQNVSTDALKKSIDALQKLLLPHWAEDTKKKAEKAKQTLMREVSRGPLKVKVVSRSKKRRR
jgi:hypothetical protein